MKTLILSTIFVSFAWAQGQETHDGEFLRSKLNELNKATYEIAQDFAKDPRFEVTDNEDHITIKPKTKPTVDPVNSEELEKIDNLQQLVSLSLGFSGTTAPKRYFGKLPVQEKNRIYSAPTIDFEVGFRPPVKKLKKLFLGYGTGMYKNDPPDVTPDTQLLRRGGEIGAWYHAGFVSWDVLVLKKARAIISTGYKLGRHPISSSLDGSPTFSSTQLEHTGTARWTQYLGRDSGTGAQVFFQYGRTSNGANVISGGFSYVLGPDWPFMKREKTK